MSQTCEVRPSCLWCNRPLRAYRYRDEDWADGRLWGSFGDGLFCGKTCGYKYAVKNVRILIDAAKQRNSS